MNGVDDCNLALGYIGQGAREPVESITGADTSEAASACRLVFRPTLRLLLRQFRWPFAQKAVPLSLLAGVVTPGYAYTYGQPSDCLYIHGLSDGTFDPVRSPATLCRAPFALRMNAATGAQVIATDIPNAWVHYTCDIEDTTAASSSFHEMLSWHLAARLALVLRASADIARNAQDQARAWESRAAAQMINEAGVDPVPDPDDVRARTGDFGVMY
jgi:hypothetical protein